MEEEGSLGRTHTPPAEQPLLLSAPQLVTRDAGFSRPVCKTTVFLTLGKPRIRPHCELKFDSNFHGIKFKRLFISSEEIQKWESAVVF